MTRGNPAIDLSGFNQLSDEVGGLNIELKELCKGIVQFGKSLGQIAPMPLRDSGSGAKQSGEASSNEGGSKDQRFAEQLRRMTEALTRANARRDGDSRRSDGKGPVSPGREDQTEKVADALDEFRRMPRPDIGTGGVYVPIGMRFDDYLAVSEANPFGIVSDKLLELTSEVNKATPESAKNAVSATTKALDGVNFGRKVLEETEAKNRIPGNVTKLLGSNVLRAGRVIAKPVGNVLNVAKVVDAVNEGENRNAIIETAGIIGGSIGGFLGGTGGATLGAATSVGALSPALAYGGYVAGSYLGEEVFKSAAGVVYDVFTDPAKVAEDFGGELGASLGAWAGFFSAELDVADGADIGRRVGRAFGKSFFEPSNASDTDSSQEERGGRAGYLPGQETNGESSRNILPDRPVDSATGAASPFSDSQSMNPPPQVQTNINITGDVSKVEVEEVTPNGRKREVGLNAALATS